MNAASIYCYKCYDKITCEVLIFLHTWKKILLYQWQYINVSSCSMNISIDNDNKCACGQVVYCQTGWSASAICDCWPADTQNSSPHHKSWTMYVYIGVSKYT